MKTIVKIIPVLAFVLAFGSAYASTILVDANSRQKVMGDQGNLFPGTCEVILIGTTCNTTNPRFCDIQSGSNWYRYFSDNNCTAVLRKP